MDTIVVGVDNSAASTRAVEFAVDRAQRNTWKLVLVHVIPWTPFSFQTPAENEHRHRERQREIEAATEQVLAPMAAIAERGGVPHDRGRPARPPVGDACSTSPTRSVPCTSSSDAPVTPGLRDAVFGSVASRLVQTRQGPRDGGAVMSGTSMRERQAPSAGVLEEDSRHRPRGHPRLLRHRCSRFAPKPITWPNPTPEFPADATLFDKVSGWITALVFYGPSAGGEVDDPTRRHLAHHGAIFFTIWLGFLNVRGFKHAIDLVRGKYSDPDDAGEVSHFQALATAVSGTVGLGNIAGVAIAISIGGPERPSG